MAAPLTNEELIRLASVVMENINGQFQLWLTITFGVIIASYVAGHRLSSLLRWSLAVHTETGKAEALAGRLSGKGYKAYVEPTLVNGTEYFRVRIGPAGDRNRMAQIADQVGKDFKVDAQVKRYP